jgi:hypothetical protein
MALTKVKTQMINPDATRIVQDRSRIDYQTPTSVKCYVPENIVMGGFRFMGSYKKGNGLYISSGVGTNGWLEVSQTTDLAFEATPHYENWYAVFALANDGDSVATMKHVPFFRAASVSTNVIALAQGGETDGDTVTATTYNIATNALVGAEVLIIQEGRQFSGKTTTVTANTNSTITVANASSMGANDFFIVSPPAYDNYCYLGSWYLDTSEPRNMADALQEVNSWGVDVIGLPTSGAIPTATRYSLAGQVSPLSTGYIMQLSFTLDTTSQGDCAHYIWHDLAAHQTYQQYDYKVLAAAQTFVESANKVLFSREQALFISTAGSLTATITLRTIRSMGWIEM